MVPALRATSTVRLGVPGGMVAIEVTSPARPRSSASARVTASSISSGEMKPLRGRAGTVRSRLSVARVSMVDTLYDFI